MIPVTQTIVGKDNPRANCLAAALASVYECGIEDILDYSEIDIAGQNWWIAVEADGEKHGYQVSAEEDGSVRPRGYHIAVGKSPRGEFSHAVVALDGTIVHDPHPSQAGLLSIDWWILLQKRIGD
jgi:hypothetical protein